MNRRKQAALLVIRNASQGHQIGDALRELRAADFSMGESCVALAEGLDIDLGIAQRIVFESETWADRAESQHRLNEAFWNALEEISERQPDGSIVIDLTDLDER